MDSKEEKQIARRRRERRLRAWLMTLSWTTPVVAFGGFFTIWHHISSAINPSQQLSKATIVSSASSNKNTAKGTVLYQIGSRGQQVHMIQEQLAELGYFHHATTQYYGPVTADAVTAFQADHNLSQTGTIDKKTLETIQTAIRNNNTNNLIQSSDNSVAQNNPDSGQTSSDSSSNVGGNGLSQQQSPVTTTSAS